MHERFVDLAVLQPGDRVELVGGHLVVREPQGSPHAVALGPIESVSLLTVPQARIPVAGLLP